MVFLLVGRIIVFHQTPQEEGTAREIFVVDIEDSEVCRKPLLPFQMT